MLPFPTGARKRTLARTDVVPRTLEDHKLFKRVFESRIKTSQSTQTAKRRQANLECEGVIGSLTSATIAAAFERILNLGCCRVVFNRFRVFEVTRVAFWVNQRDFPDFKINTISQSLLNFSGY